MYECSICLEKINEKNFCLTECEHLFHFSCVTKVKNGLCPLCRKELFQIPNETIVIEINPQENIRNDYRGSIIFTIGLVVCTAVWTCVMLFGKN